MRAGSNRSHEDGSRRETGILAGAAEVLVRLVGWQMARSPAWLLDGMARALATLWYHVIPVRRALALDNVAQALGSETSARAQRGIVKEVGYHFGRNYLEFLALPFLPRARLENAFRWEGREHLERALAGGKGVLVLTAHIGAFDLLAAAVATQGMPLTIVSRTPRSRWVKAVWMGYRQAAGVEVLPERGSVFQVLRALSRGRMVALMLDQNVHADRGVFVEFFGRPACTSDSLAVLALRTGAPVVPVFTHRESRDRHVVRCLPPIPLPSRQGDRKAAIRAMTQVCTTVIEEEVRATPEQWLWLHNRWKTRPQS